MSDVNHYTKKHSSTGDIQQLYADLNTMNNQFVGLGLLSTHIETLKIAQVDENNDRGVMILQFYNFSFRKQINN